MGNQQIERCGAHIISQLKPKTMAYMPLVTELQLLS